MSNPSARHPGIRSVHKEQLLKPAVSFRSEVELRVEVVDASSEPDDGIKRCRICKSMRETDLIAPCLCLGAERWVHRKCLNRKRVDTSNPRLFTYCLECHFQYKMILKRPPSQDGTSLGERRRAMIKKIAKHSFLSFLVVQFWLLLVALLVKRAHGVGPAARVVGITDSKVIARHMQAASYCVAIGVTAVICSIIGIGFWFLSCCRAVRERMERELLPESDRPQDQVAEAAEGDIFGCDDCRFYCGRLCEDQPKCEVPCPWFHTLLDTVKNSFWHSNANETDDGVPEGFTDSDYLNMGSASVNGAFGEDVDEEDAGGHPQVGNNDEAMTWILLASILALILLAALGIVILFIVAAIWLQKVVVKSFQLHELKGLSKEYEVENLAMRTSRQENEDYLPDSLDNPDKEVVVIEHYDGRRSSTISMTRATINASLMHDLTYLYGYEVTPPVATRAVSSVSRSVGSGVRSMGLKSGVASASRSAPLGGSSSVLSFARMGSHHTPIRPSRSV